MNSQDSISLLIYKVCKDRNKTDVFVPMQYCLFWNSFFEKPGCAEDDISNQTAIWMFSSVSK